MPERDMTRFSELAHSKYASIDSFLDADAVPDGVITIDYNGAPLDILNINRLAKTTIIMFHASLSTSVEYLPVFSGLRMLRGLDVNVICLSDPTLARDPHLKLAWFAGNKWQPLQRDLPNLLRKIADAQHAEHSVFFGASGGGFAALYYSAFQAGSLAVVLNPQTVIRAYTDSFVLSYAKAAFGARNLEQARSFVDRAVTGDLRHIYRGGSSNTVAYVQNYMDIQHLHRHAKSFLDAIPTSTNIHMLLGNWGKGHVAPPADLSRGILESAAMADGDWGKALSENNFVRSPTSELLMHARESATD